MKCHKQWLKFFQIGLSMECTRWHKNQQAYLEVIWKENKTDDVICLHFGVYGNICGHMIPSSVYIPKHFFCFTNPFLSHMSRIMRKPDFCLCENKGADQLRSNCEADQRLCFPYMDSSISLLSKSKISSL